MPPPSRLVRQDHVLVGSHERQLNSAHLLRSKSASGFSIKGGFASRDRVLVLEGYSRQEFLAHPGFLHSWLLTLSMSFPYYHLLLLYVLIMSWYIDAQWYLWSSFSYLNRSSMCRICMVLFYVWCSFCEFLLLVLHPKNQDHTVT